MPSGQPWEIGLRAQVNALGVGWGVRENRGLMYLRLTVDGHQKQVPVGFAWNKSNAANAYVRIRNIIHLYEKGSDLKTAALAAKAESKTAVHDWGEVAEKYREQKINHGNTIKPSTWEKEYAPVISQAIELLQSRRPPTTAAELIEVCIRRWEAGSRTRQIRARHLQSFLEFAVQRHQFPQQWQPITSLRDHIGRPKTNLSGSRGKRSKGDPLDDQQVIDLINSIPTDEAGIRWANGLKLIALYGLRPVELRYLSIKRDLTDDVEGMFCSYQKRSGGGTTQPRFLFPIPLADVDWQLFQLMRAGLLKLPTLRSDSSAAGTFRDYLRRQIAWRSLIEAQAAKGQTLNLYSLRHSYSLRGHRLGIPSGAMADAMGHSLESHHREYAWASPATTRAAFKNISANASAYMLNER